MKHKNMTFSIPDDLQSLMRQKIGNRGFSQFISEAIRTALIEKEIQDEKILDAAYLSANKDLDRLETLKDWDSVDDVSDLVDDEDWEWLKNG